MLHKAYIEGVVVTSLRFTLFRFKFFLYSLPNKFYSKATLSTELASAPSLDKKRETILPRVFKFRTVDFDNHGRRMNPPDSWDRLEVFLVYKYESPCEFVFLPFGGS